MNLFIDTNIFLSFYHFTSDDLEQLKKLRVLLREKKTKLYLPEQLVDEFWRNRENKIAQALKGLREQRLNFQFPQLCKDYDDYAELKELQKQYEQKHSALLKALKLDIDKAALKADQIIKTLFSVGKRVSLTDGLISKAKVRSERGNPPGKKGSIGDAINWECLLDALPDGQDLYFITDDADYCSPLNDDKPDHFLSTEWETRKQSSLVLYKTLSHFFRDKFPEIKLASELEKELLIKKLAASGSFQKTHQIISKLSKYQEFTPGQLNDLVAAIVSNYQVNWILSDPDIYSFVTRAISGHHAEIDEDNLKSLLELLGDVVST